MDNNQFNSKLKSIENITDESLFFNIPIYQRPYIWGEEQVKTLMEDIYSAALKDEDFHLGGVLIVKNDDRYDLIDGQQRFTTLWLIAKKLEKMKKSCEELSKFRHDGKSRIHFSIRDHFNTYLENGMNADHKDLIKVMDAESWIKAQIEASKISPDVFSKFLYKKVKLIVTEVPKRTDLNKLFEVINNRGVQLQQHEILKAKILKKIDPKEHSKYASLWNACADMNNYLEKNACESFGLLAKDMCKLKDEMGSAKNTWEKKKKLIKENSTSVEQENTEKQATLMTILSSNPKMLAKIKINEAQDEYTSVRSIVSFPLFLLHVLRVYLYANKGCKYSETQDGKIDVRKHVSDKKLIQLFKANFLETLDADKAKSFIELLWKLRWSFDNHVVKWVKSDESYDEFLCIGKIEEYNSNGDKYLRRKFIDSKSRLDDMSMLQSMLYHSQELITQHWLSPFLYRMIKSDENADLFPYLQKLDNQLIWVKSEKPLAEHAWESMDILPENALPNWSLLNEAKGTAFPHYWFYKLEFVLWFQANKDLFGDTKLTDKFKAYRIISKNSVEHVSAQTDREEESSDNRITNDKRDYFGNLALVSREFNSSAGNKSVREKKEAFEAKNKLESLKLALIYKEKIWNDDKAEHHKNAVITFMKNYWTYRCQA